MKIAVMGTGMVGQALAGRLVELGHDVMMGARDAGNSKAAEWAHAHDARSGSYGQAAAFGDLVVFAVRGGAVLDAAAAAGKNSLQGKVVVDVTNPLDTSGGGVPTLIAGLSNTTSAGEELQKAYPAARVVKALNTVNSRVMVEPTRVPGVHDIFLCGNDAAAKAEVVRLLQDFGWASPIDLGPIEAARGMEGLMPFWLRLWQAVGTGDFNYHIAR